MPLRNYANAPATTLTAACSSVATTLAVASVSGLPISYPYTLILDRGTATEEAVSVTGAAALNLTVTRGIDSTTAFAHTIGATVTHGITAQDIREANTHVNTNSGVHGATGTVVGTSDSQTLTNKTVNLTSNTLSGTKAQFNTALSDANFRYSDDAELGGWIAYTPTLAGGFSAGSGAVLAGRYIQFGKTVHAKARWVLGTGFTIGNGIGLSLPVAPSVAVLGLQISNGWLGSSGSNVWVAGTGLGTNSINVYVIGTNGVAVAINNTTPFTWKATDTIDVAVTYEAL